MKLLIDAGNTRIKWALADGVTRCAQASGAGMPPHRFLPQTAGCAITSDLASVVCSPGRVSSSYTSNVPEADDDDAWVQSGAVLTAQAGGLPQQFAGMQELQEIWVSNVAGEEVARHIRNIGAARHIQTHFIDACENRCGVRNNYADPSRLGSDRWAALIAAWHLVGRNCLVVNSGTATTIDALSASGEFIGGLILPGIGLMQRSLSGATAQLGSAQGAYAAFPLNTADAVLSGAIQASCGAIQRQHALLGDDNAPVMLNGGAAETLREHLLNLPLRMVDNLALQGLLLIAREAGA